MEPGKLRNQVAPRRRPLRPGLQRKPPDRPHTWRERRRSSKCFPRSRLRFPRPPITEGFPPYKPDPCRWRKRQWFPATPSAKVALMEEMLVNLVVERTDMPSVKAPNPVRSRFSSPSAEREKAPFTLIPVPAPPASASVLALSTFKLPVKKGILEHGHDVEAGNDRIGEGDGLVSRAAVTAQQQGGGASHRAAFRHPQRAPRTKLGFLTVRVAFPLTVGFAPPPPAYRAPV